MATWKVFSNLSSRNLKFCTKGYKYVKRSSLPTSVFKRRLLRCQNLLSLSALVHTVFQHSAVQAVRAFVLKSELSSSIVYQQKLSQTMRVVPHKPFLLATVRTLSAQKRVSWIHHIHHFPRVVTLLPFSAVPYILLQCTTIQFTCGVLH